MALGFQAITVSCATTSLFFEEHHKNDFKCKPNALIQFKIFLLFCVTFEVPCDTILHRAYLKKSVFHITLEKYFESCVQY